ncbi:ubiquitin-conjugating enzyme E2 C-like [Amphiura filiformis]|uniref:ubiquitin-conjugating enzyme E2 C-like n=1 Tax=Amphiura filiformis TaxID=82378 RepID=UPI003B21325F
MAQNVDPAMVAAPQRRGKESTVETSSNRDGHSVSKRLQRELMALMMSASPGISAFPEGDDIFKWVGTLEGAAGTVYEDLKYKISLHFPSKYPYSAPTVKFVTPIFHPNVDQRGNICLDILKEKWSALYDVRTILLSLQSLLGEPNNESPLNLTAAKLWDAQGAYKKKLLEEYEANVKGKFTL